MPRTPSNIPPSQPPPAGSVAVLSERGRGGAVGGAPVSPVLFFEPAMVRDLSGVIQEWNRSAELAYGFTRDEAVGKVSHLLLHTVFPRPLKGINQQLLDAGSWEGELLHVLNDGRRVRVQSRWEVQSRNGEAELTIVEFNRRFEELDPESSHFESASPASADGSLLKALSRLGNNRRLWVVLLLLALFALEVKIELRKSITPIHDYRR